MPTARQPKSILTSVQRVWGKYGVRWIISILEEVRVMRSDLERKDQVCSQSWNRRTQVQLYPPKFGSKIAPECN